MVPFEWAAHFYRQGQKLATCVQADSPLAQRLEAHHLPFAAFRQWHKYWTPGLTSRLKQLFRDSRTDVIIAHRSSDLWNLAPVIQADHFPRLVFVNHILNEHVAKDDWLHQRLYRKIDAVITLSELGKTFFIRTTGMPASKVHVIPNGIDVDRFAAARNQRAKQRQMLHVEADTIMLLLVGRIDPLKGQLEFIRSLPSIIDKFPKVRAYIVGEPTHGEWADYHEELKQTVQKLNLNNHVVFAGYQADVAQWYAAADLFVMPSYRETFGLVLLEAMASGVPVIATDSGAPPEILRDGQYGLLVKPKSADAIAKGVLHLLSHPEQMQQFRQAGINFVRSQYSLNVVLQRILTLCNNLSQSSV